MKTTKQTAKAAGRAIVVLLALTAAAVADEHPLPNPEILRQQFEAQERERAVNRDRDIQIAHAAGQSAGAPPKAEVVQ